MQNPVECKNRVVNIAGSAGYDEKSKFPYEYVADVKDEYDQSISLPDLRTNLPAMKENQWFFLMGT